MNLTFNKEINAVSIFKFSLYIETLFYDLNTLKISQISETTISVNFDFTHIPKGGYNLGMLYKGEEYIFFDIFLNITKKTNYLFNLKNTIYNLIKPKRKTKNGLM